MVDFFRCFADHDDGHPAELVRIDGLTCSRVAGAPPTLFNRVMEAGLREPLGEPTLERIERYYRERGCRFRIGIAPGAQPADLAEHLEARGYERGMDWMRFGRGTDGVPEVRCTLAVRALSAADAEPLSHVLGAAFGMPPFVATRMGALPGRPGWSVFGAFAGDELVAGAGLFVDGPLGWLGFAGTLESARGRGAQKALLAARIREARCLGATDLTVETGTRQPNAPSPSYDNILAMGFTEAYRRRHYDATDRVLAGG